MKLSNFHKRLFMLAVVNKKLLERSWLLEAMTVVSEYTHDMQDVKTGLVGTAINVFKTDCKDQLSVGDIVRTSSGLCMVTGSNEAGDHWVFEVMNGDLSRPTFHRLDTYDFGPLDSQYFGNVPFVQIKPGLTTVGRMLENAIIFGYPMNWQFPYFNGVMKDSYIMGTLADLAVDKKIDVSQLEQALDNAFFINHMTEICVPTLTLKSLMTHPDVPRVKKEFIEAHKDEMDNPLVAKELEDKLKALDKEYIGDDPSARFFDGLGGKSWDLHRKKLFLTVGCIDAFSDSSGEFDFIPNSLMEGWTKEAFPVICNEIRKGSYSRGKETAKGGAETKLVMRVFQDLSISNDDCGTTRTIEIDFNEVSIKKFIGRTIRVGNVDVVLTHDNIGQYDKQVQHMYSPLTCETKRDFCYKCCGERARELGAKFIGIQTVKITSTFMYLAMKNMHGTTLKVNNIDLASVLL